MWVMVIERFSPKLKERRGIGVATEMNPKAAREARKLKGFFLPPIKTQLGVLRASMLRGVICVGVHMSRLVTVVVFASSNCFQYLFYFCRLSA